MLKLTWDHNWTYRYDYTKPVNNKYCNCCDNYNSFEQNRYIVFNNTEGRFRSANRCTNCIGITPYILNSYWTIRADIDEL